MKQTAPLTVETGFTDPNKISIHPNDGYDLKLYSITYAVNIYSNCSLEDFQNSEGENIEGEIFLSNDMTPGKVKLQKKFWEKIGKPHQVVLHYDSNKIFIENK